MACSEEDKKKIVDTICESIEQGKSLRDATIGLIPRNTFYQWIDSDKIKANQYARACEERADLVFEEILSIADDQEDDVGYDNEGNEITNHNVIQRARLRVDSRKWMLGKMNPKKYGDKIQNEITTKIDLSDLTDEELRKKANDLLGSN